MGLLGILKQSPPIAKTVTTITIAVLAIAAVLLAFGFGANSDTAYAADDVSVTAIDQSVVGLAVVQTDDGGLAVQPDIAIVTTDEAGFTTTIDSTVIVEQPGATAVVQDGAAVPIDVGQNLLSGQFALWATMIAIGAIAALTTTIWASRSMRRRDATISVEGNDDIDIISDDGTIQRRQSEQAHVAQIPTIGPQFPTPTWARVTQWLRTARVTAITTMRRVRVTPGLGFLHVSEILITQGTKRTTRTPTPKESRTPKRTVQHRPAAALGGA